MRITAGLYRNRILKVPEGLGVRPTTDKVRQAIFNILQADNLPRDAVVIDGFCGSGSLGLEALSRGAAHVTFIEADKAHLSFTQDNAKGIKVQDQCTFILQDVRKITALPSKQVAADLVFLDPPYRQDLLPDSLNRLAQYGWLAPEATLVCEHENHAAIAWPSGFVLTDQRRYGDSQVSFLRYKPES